MFGAEGAILNGERSETFLCADGSERGGACAAEGGPAGVWGRSPQPGLGAEPRWGLGGEATQKFLTIICDFGVSWAILKL